MMKTTSSPLAATDCWDWCGNRQFQFGIRRVRSGDNLLATAAIHGDEATYHGGHREERRSLQLAVT